METWISQHEKLLLWVTGFSILTFVGTLILLPIMAVRIPTHYFNPIKRQRFLWRKHPPLIRFFLLLAKNILGIAFILSGIAMVFLPGQGLITIFIGIILTDFPGKFKFERWIIQHKVILQSINWLRAKQNRPPLKSKWEHF